MNKAVWTLVVLAALGLLGWQIFARVMEAQEPVGTGGGRGAPVAVEVADAMREPISDVARFSGTLVPHSYFVVAPKVAGRLERLFVDIGDIVESPVLVAVLDDAEYAQQVEQARAELRVAEANVEEARSARDVEQREYERIAALREKQIASESEHDAARARFAAQESRYRVAQAQVAQRAAALAASEVRLSYTNIDVSWEGGTRWVAERFVHEGTMLRANDPIVSIIDISSMTAEIYVIERDYAKIRVGQQALIRADALGGTVFEGEVVRVAPLLRERSRQARVEIKVDNPHGLLKPGMFAQAQINFGTRENATVVPVASLVRRNNVEGVFVADMTEMKASFVPVKLGIQSGGRVEILEGDIEGPVVVLGQHLLSDGASIVVPEVATSVGAAPEEAA